RPLRAGLVIARTGIGLLVVGGRQHRDLVAPGSLRRLGRFGRGFFGCGRRREVGLGDPAGLEAGLHDQRFAVLAAQFKAVEEARLVLGLAILPLGPAGQVVGRATREILDRLDAVLT